MADKILYPRTEVFDVRPVLFDMFNILVSPTDETERQMIRRLPDWRRFTFVGNHKSVDVGDQNTFIVPYFLQHSSARGIGP